MTKKPFRPLEPLSALTRPGLPALVPGLIGGMVVTIPLFVLMGQLGVLLVLVVPVLLGTALGLAVSRLGLPSWAPAAGLLLYLVGLPAFVFLHLRVLGQSVPLPSNAQGAAVRVSLGDWMSGPFAQVTYRTALPFDEAAAFYQSELTGRGWSRDHCFDMAGYTSYTFLRGNSKYLIVIWAASEAGTRAVEVTRYYPTSRPLRLLEGGCTPVTPIQVLLPPGPDTPRR